MLVTLPDYPDYSITATGSVYRTSRDGVELHPPVPVKKCLNRYGYEVVNLRLNGRRCQPRVNILVLTAFVGPKPHPKMQAAHLNGKRADNRVENLIWATCKENHSHKIAHGTMVRGEDHKRSKMTESMVREIRLRLSSGEKVDEIKGDYPVSRANLYYIANRQIWRHVV